MATTESSAPAQPSTEDQDHDHQDERPHACSDGWVTIGQVVLDPETGEETEEFALYLCRRCLGIAASTGPNGHAATTSEGAIIVPD